MVRRDLPLPVPALKCSLSCWPACRKALIRPSHRPFFSVEVNCQRSTVLGCLLVTRWLLTIYLPNGYLLVAYILIGCSYTGHYWFLGCHVTMFKTSPASGFRTGRCWMGWCHTGYIYTLAFLYYRVLFPYSLETIKGWYYKPLPTWLT